MPNLLANAIRHTPADGVVTVAGGSDGQGAWLAVADACGCIPEEGGGGLGLALARGLIEAHHGESAVSDTDDGCRFVVRLRAEVVG